MESSFEFNEVQHCLLLVMLRVNGSMVLFVTHTNSCADFDNPWGGWKQLSTVLKWTSLTGKLDDLVTLLLGSNEVEFVLSCAPLSCLLRQSFPQLPLICCQFLGLSLCKRVLLKFTVSFTCDVRIEVGTSKRTAYRMSWQCLLSVWGDPDNRVSQVKLTT
jgi:hypothetical protein